MQSLAKINRDESVGLCVIAQTRFGDVLQAASIHLCLKGTIKLAADSQEMGASSILIVDDEQTNVTLLETLLQMQGYTTLSALSGAEALTIAVNQKPDLILLDVMMPDMDGFETVTKLKDDLATRHVPVIMITALEDRETKTKALEAGAEEFISKPINLTDLTIRVRNLLRLKKYSDLLTGDNLALEELVRLRTEQLDEAYCDTVLTLVRAAEHKDEGTGHHIKRIGQYCRMLATAMKFRRSFANAIFYASPMHDIGKIGIPDTILLKTSGLTPDEWIIMKTHCTLGASILSSGTSPYVKMGAEIALNHHERWDGSGYPNGRRGEEIPISARIMQICDAYDALRSRRPYKDELTHQRAVEIISDGDGRTQPEHFDPNVLDHFRKHSKQFEMIYELYHDG